MVKFNRKSIKNWKPYDVAFEKTSKILSDINELATSDSLSDSQPDSPLHLLLSLDLPLTLALFTGNKTPPSLLNDMFHLMKSNMKSLYDKSNFYGGWDDRKKFSELKYYRTHIIALLNEDSLVGFASYRFVVMREFQDPAPVCYIYELHVKDSFRGKGLGRLIIFVLEIVARSMSCLKLMCTVLTSNRRALSFYLDKCNFVSDESDPDREYRVIKLMLN